MQRVCVCHRQLGLDLVPRREFSMVDPDELSVTELYKLVSVHTEDTHTYIQTYTHTNTHIHTHPGENPLQ